MSPERQFPTTPLIKLGAEFKRIQHFLKRFLLLLLLHSNPYFHNFLYRILRYLNIKFRKYLNAAVLLSYAILHSQFCNISKVYSNKFHSFLKSQFNFSSSKLIIQVRHDPGSSRTGPSHGDWRRVLWEGCLPPGHSNHHCKPRGTNRHPFKLASGKQNSQWKSPDS